MCWYHLDTSQLKCIHSMWRLCWSVEQLPSCSPCCQCIMLVALCNYGAHARVFLPYIACEQTKGFMLLMEGVVWPIQLDILTWYAVCAQELGSRAFVHCVGALLSLVSFVACATCRCTTKGHPESLFCKQGQCIHGNCQKYHVMDASLSLLWLCWNHHLVTHNILLNL